MTSIYFEDTESTGDPSANKFWCRPSDSRSSSFDDNNVFIAFESEVGSMSQKRGYDGGLLLGQQQSTSASKRRQTKMLLVALIETFCRLYGDSPPDANHKIFFLICQALRSLGIIDSEFVDEMASVRSTFQSAFQRLFYTAVQTVRDQNLFLSQKRLITSAVGLDETAPPSSSTSVVPSESTMSSSQISSEQLLFNLSVQNSRYMNDFIEVHMLGKGGFASVWRARNKLDGIDYAVKKVRLGRDLDTGKQMPYEKIFREIKHLARLEHHNVVRYYSSWLEYATAAQSHGDSKYTVDETTDLPTVIDDGDESLEHSSSFRSQEGEWVLYIQMQLCPATLYDYIKYRNQRCRDGHNAVDPKRNIEIFTQILEGAAYIHQQGLIHRDLKPTNIFLSMPTSEHQRRSSAGSVARRRSRSSSVSVSSFASFKCKRGHHDMSLESVTSSNGICDCMWEEPWIPKIGDFGLAAALAMENDPSNLLLHTSLPTLPAPSTQSSDESGVSFLTATSPRSSPPSSRRSDRPSYQRTRTSGVGTRTYASPEQMARTPNAYDEKSDIYSLGIIFFELYKPFSTGMERAEELEALKQGVFPDGFVEQYPKESALILWMMDRNPEHRPSAAELLEFELFAETKDDTFASLQSELQAKSLALDNKTLEVAALRQRMEQLEREKQRELEAMQRRLQEMQRQLEQAHISQSSSSCATGNLS